jgi:dipeptidyl aminopeptidase/acylaminoacyl peptidase
MKRCSLLLASLIVVLVAAPAWAAPKRPMTIDDLFRFKRVADPQISPDGKTVAYVVTAVDLPGNKTSSSIWLVSTDGGQTRQLTNTTKKDRHPRWSPDGRQILFESTRSGDNQLWVIDVTGGEARQLTTLSTGASTGLWSPDGQMIAFVSAVYPEYSDKPFKESDELNRKRKEEIEKNPVKARTFKRLFFRHWDEWVEDKRQHLFVMPFNDAKGGEPKDVTPGDHDANPTSDTFSVGDDFTFSPNGKYLVYTAPPERNEAWSTNYDVWRVPVAGGQAECLTRDNPAADTTPRFSPDGTKLAYRAQRRPGFEADQWDLQVVDVDEGGAFRGKPQSVVPRLRESVEEFAWATIWNRRSAGTGFLFTADHQGSRPIYAIAANGDLFFASPEAEGARASLSVSRDGKRFAFALAKLTAPAEVYVDSVAEARGAEAKLVSHANDLLLAELDRPRPESVTVDGAGGTPMQLWVLKPPGFDPAKKWPLAFLVHGGPQGAWEDGWSYRWNPELWAAQGYVVALPNPRGSTGFGQKYVDEISGDWGGKCYEDLMAGLAYLEKQPYIDTSRMAAAGASFGGYMMNWFEGHTTKFKTLITHCGVYNFDSMYALTDELWFDEWEHGGPPWAKRDSYEKHSPHRFAKNFKTPVLIIHNDLDFRVPVAEGLQLFTTLQRLGVPSKMINFPDEGHWVLKPANSAYWHREVFAWLKKYAPPGGR